jgi:hypothetical protein
VGPQITPQAPQFTPSVAVLTHMPPQLVKPDEHPVRHTLDSQYAKGATSEQRLPQVPQLVESARRSTHAPAHRKRPPGQPSRHCPPAQTCVPAHAVVVNPRPSGLHTRRAPSGAQSAALGAHTRATQRPALQTSLPAQGVSVEPAPRASQTRTAVALAQVRALGAQTRGPQVSSPRHRPSVQSLSPAQSTHSLRVGWHTWLSSEHSRDERQVRAAGTQRFARQRSPEAQSVSPVQSTQRPAAVSQT